MLTIWMLYHKARKYNTNGNPATGIFMLADIFVCVENI